MGSAQDKVMEVFKANVGKKLTMTEIQEKIREMFEDEKDSDAGALGRKVRRVTRSLEKWSIIKLTSKRVEGKSKAQQAYVFPKEKAGGAKKTTVRRVENVLYAGITSKPKLFRSGGPRWIDFEKGYVVERKEADEIINEFKKKKKIVLVKGSSGSGKSTLLKNIGYKLSNRDKKKVYVIELKKEKPPIKDILELDRDDVYLIVDDVHLAPRYANEIIQKLKHSKLLLGSRDIGFRFGPITPYAELKDYFEDARQIKVEDIAKSIIQKFYEKNPKMQKLPELIMESLNRHNLAILEWELEAYKEGYTKKGKLSTVQFLAYEKVKNFMRRDLKELGVNRAEDVFLPLSSFYSYEFPVEREFIESFARSEDIEKLIELGEIEVVEKGGYEYLLLYHSSLARIFKNTFHHFDGLGRNVKNKVEEKSKLKWNEGLINLYLREYPKKSFKLLEKISWYWFSSGIFSRVISPIIEQNIQQLRVGLEKENNWEVVISCFVTISHLKKASSYFKKLIGGFDPDILKEKITTFESARDGEYLNLGALTFMTFFLSCIMKGDERIFEKIVEKIDSEFLKKLEEEKRAFKISVNALGYPANTFPEGEKVFSYISKECKRRKLK